MRLSAEQVEAIKQETEHCFGAQAEVWLFGSRVDKHQRGFTLVELIMTMVILGIIAAVAIPRFFDNSVFQNRGAADQVKAALRYGQKVAIAQHRVVSVTISTAATSNCGANLTGGNVDCAIQVAFTGGSVIYFNALGRPVTDATGTVPVTTNSTFVVGGITTTIEQETGYVH